MKRLIAPAVVVLALLPLTAQAQIKLPVFEEDRGPLQNLSFQEATSRADLQHGKLLRVTVAGSKDPIRGVLVRVDRTKGRLYLRTEPGAPPRMIAISDIKSVDKGVIREVNFTGDYSSPEIMPLVVYNGLRKSVSYTAPSLSPGEMAYLRDLATAENEIARLEHQMAMEDRVLQNDIAMQEEQRRTQRIVTDLLWRQYVWGGFTAGANHAIFTGDMPSTGFRFWPDAPVFGATPLPFVRVGSFPRLSVAPDSLTQARQALVTAQNRAVYENGRVVAVVLDDQSK